MPPAAAALLRAGATSGGIMALSDILAQAIASSGFTQAALEPLRTLRYLVLGLAADGPFWHSAFGLVERLFGASTGASGATRWSVLAKKTLFTQGVVNPVWLVILLLLMSLLEGRRTLSAMGANVRAKLPGYLRDGMIFWSVANFLNFRFTPVRHRLLFSGLAGACWSTWFSLTNKLRDTKMREQQEARGMPHTELVENAPSGGPDGARTSCAPE